MQFEGDIVEEAAQSFLERVRRGETPAIDEYTARCPERAVEIRNTLSAILDMEALRGRLAIHEPPSAKPAPERIGEYRIIRELGRGGMGVVYEAEQAPLGRRVALKVMPSQPLLHGTRLERFHLEARALARLRHPGIVPVFGVGEEGGFHYYAMQFIEGKSLDRVIHERAHAAGSSSLAGRSWYEEAARIVLQAAEALVHAHAEGILHRDVKPSNILLDPSGKAWVTDFGLAKTENAPAVTQSGEVVGTLPYMAPERFQGWSDPRSDVYGLGLTLYELLTLRPAFADTDRSRLLKRVVEEDPVPPGRLAPGLARDLENIVLRATAKEPARRYPQAAALAEDLRSFLEGRPVRARPSSMVARAAKWARRRKAAAGLIAVSILAAAALLTGALWHNARLKRSLEDLKAEKSRTEKREYAARKYLYNAQMNQGLQAWRSNDVARCLEVLRSQEPQPGQEDLRGFEWHYLWRLCHRSALPIRAEKSVQTLFTADGALAATVHGSNEVRLWDVDSGKELRTLADDRAWFPRCDLSPGGATLAAPYADGSVKVWDAGRGAERMVLREAGFTAWAVKFLPGRAALAAGGEDGSLRVWDLESGKVRMSVPGKGVPGSPLRVSSGGRFAMALASRGVLLGDLEGGGEPVEALSRTSVLALAFSPDGRSLAAGTREGLRLLDPGSGAERARSEVAGSFLALAFSPDGSQIAAGRYDRRVGIYDAGSLKEKHSLQGHTGLLHAVAFAGPAGRLLTAGEDGVRVWDLDGQGEPLLIRAHEGRISSLAYSPDGQRMASGGSDGWVRIWDAFRGEEIASARGLGEWVEMLAFSGDGKLLVLAAAGALVILDAWTGSERWRLADEEGALHAAFDPAGGRIACVGPRGKRVRLVDAAGGRVTGSLEAPGLQATELAFAPEGKQLAVGYRGGWVKIWEVASLAEAFSFRPSQSTIQRLEFSRDGRLIAAATSGSDLPVSDARTGTHLAVFGHTDSVSSLAFSPDGTSLAVATGGRAAKIWDLFTREERLTLEAEPLAGGLGCVAFSPSGRSLAAGGSQGVIALWRGAEDEDREVEAIATLSGRLARRRTLQTERLERLHERSVAALARPDPRRLHALAMARAAAGDREAAILLLEEVAELPDALREHVEPLGRLRREALPDLPTCGTIDAALDRAGAAGPDAWEAFRTRGSTRRLTYLDGRLLQLAGKPAEAAEIFRGLLDLDPARPEPLVRFAECLAAAGQAAEAAGFLSSALGDPERTNCAALWDAWWRATVVSGRRTPAEALAAFPLAAAASGEAWGRAGDYRWLLESLRDGGAARIHCGGEGHRAVDGRSFGRDRFYLSGFRFFGDRYGGARGPFEGEIAGTDDDPLYRTERWFFAACAGPAGYRIPLPPGRARVTLHFAEILVPSAGIRVFDVKLEGKQVLDGFDPAAAGFAVAQQRVFDEVMVDDGFCDLLFVARENSPKVSAIEVEPLGP